MKGAASVTSRSGTRLRIIDASAVIELLRQGERAGAVDRAVRKTRLMAPDSINPEVINAIRGLERGGEVDGGRAEAMVEDFLSMPIVRIPTRHLIPEAWSLRRNLTAYDACYVALARALEAELITGDRRLARAPDLGIALVVV
jgi:predicted nucleic acid-binding protein